MVLEIAPQKLDFSIPCNEIVKMAPSSLRMTSLFLDAGRVLVNSKDSLSLTNEVENDIGCGELKNKLVCSFVCIVQGSQSHKSNVL